MLRFFLSIKTSLWLTGLSIGSFVIGSFLIPANLHIFSDINDMPLFRWLSLNNTEMGSFFWIYLLIAFMLLLWINMCVCSIDAIIRKISWKGMVRVLSPQILHIAIMFVLLGHAVSASTGYKEDIKMKVGEAQEIRGFHLDISEVEFLKIPEESSTHWKVHMTINNESHIIETGRPAFINHVGFFVKSAQQKKMKVIIGLVHDPGVIWEIIGAVMFVVGAGGVFSARLSQPVQMSFEQKNV